MRFASPPPGGQAQTGGRSLGQETVELAQVGQARIERRDDLCRDGVEAARLDERAPLRVVVDLDGQALDPDGAGVLFREVAQLGSDSGFPAVGPDAEPEPAARAGLVPFERRGGEAQDFAVLQRQPRAALRALRLRALAMDEVGCRDEDAGLHRPYELGRCRSVCRFERTNLHEGHTGRRWRLPRF